MRSVCHTMVDASRGLIVPWAKSAATRGSRLCSATARYIWPDAIRWLMPCAGADFSGHGIPVIARPVRAVGGAIGVAAHPLGDGGESTR